MTKADLERYRGVLVSLRNRLTGDVSHLTEEAFRSRGTGGRADSGGDSGDHGAETYEQEFTLTLLQNQEQTLEEITGALERIEEGTYGHCEECAVIIPRGRLEALPYARHCVVCARKQES